MEHLVQIVGLVLFVSTGAGFDAILPVINADAHVPRHDAFILAPKGTATFDNWSHGTLVDRKGNEWDYADLNGEKITFATNNGTMTKPVFLIHLNDGCCRMIGTVRNEYQTEDPSRVAARLVVTDGEAGWSKSYDRIDTVLKLKTAAGTPLLLTATISGQMRKAYFKTDVVILNFPKKFVTTDLPASGHHHFNRYYDLVTFGMFCNKVPDKKSKCYDTTSSFPGLDYGSVIKIPVTKPGDIFPGGLDIACSNSQYP